MDFELSTDSLDSNASLLYDSSQNADDINNELENEKDAESLKERFKLLYESECNPEKCNLPYYVYMISNFNHLVRIHTHVEYSIDPDLSARLHNIGKSRASKKTKAASGSWRLELIIGPVKNEMHANFLSILWKDNTRGHTSRIERAKFLARIFELYYWDRSIPDVTTNKDISS